VAHAPCLNPWYYLVIHPDGRTSPCCVIPGIGDDARRGLDTLWSSPRGTWFAELREHMRKKEMTELCRNCSRSIIARNDYIREYLA
jgi:radical SAM protein with 4Fe4S-binding SPASM domain